MADESSWRQRSMRGRKMGISLLAVILFTTATDGLEIRRNNEPFMYKTQLGNHPMPFPRSLSVRGSSRDLKMTMLVGMCSEDRCVDMRSLPAPTQGAAVLNDTSERTELNDIEDMKMTMKMEKGSKDPLLTVFEQITTETNTSEEVQDKIREFLTISGVDIILPLDCGRHPTRPTDPLGRGVYPWLAALGSHEDGRFHYRCTGLVVSEHHVLTDADCVTSPNINVVLLNVTDAPDSSAIVNYVAGRRVHPAITDGESLLTGNNIGLLELAIPLQFNEFVQPVCLPGQFDKPDPNERSESTIVGFSINDTPSGRTASLFRWVNSRTLGAARCYTAIRKFRADVPDEETTLDSILTKKHICVDRNFELVGKSAVLRVNSGTGRVQVLGVGGVANAAKTNPIAYTHVQPHRFWIELVLKKFQDNIAVDRSET